MNYLDDSRRQKDLGSIIQIVFIRAPKKNRDALAKIGKETDEFFSKHGVSKYVYRLNTRENVMDFVNLSKIMSANAEEDVNLEILSYRDAKHLEEVMKAMEGDNRASELYNESMKIITPGSIVFGDFSQLKETQ
jgi:large subunit ribosomal protein L17